MPPPGSNPPDIGPPAVGDSAPAPASLTASASASSTAGPLRSVLRSRAPPRPARRRRVPATRPPADAARRLRGGFVFYCECNISHNVDGFFTAMRALGGAADIEWVNLARPLPPNVRHAPVDWADDLDFVLVKGAFGARVDKWARSKLGASRTPLLLAVAGVPPPAAAEAAAYAILFYETEAFAARAGLAGVHNATIHAFGVNTAALVRPPGAPEPRFDWVFVGRFVDEKRPLELLRAPGPDALKLAVGAPRHGAIGDALRAAGVAVVRGDGGTAGLVRLLCLARAMLAPQAYEGGGERAVLEARALGLRVVVPPSDDPNPKLLELLDTPVWTAAYYARRLEAGVCAAVAAARRGGARGRPPLRLPAARDGDGTADALLDALLLAGDDVDAGPGGAAGDSEGRGAWRRRELACLGVRVKPDA